MNATGICASRRAAIHAEAQCECWRCITLATACSSRMAKEEKMTAMEVAAAVQITLVLSACRSDNEADSWKTSNPRNSAKPPMRNSCA